MFRFSPNIHRARNAPRMAMGAVMKTATGRDQLSYREARIRKTNTADAAKIMPMVMPFCACFSW